jgi:hypothetical protein
MSERYLLILLAVLLLGSIGAFFLYVPILPVLEVVVILIALAGMFMLGFEAGQNPDGVTKMSHWLARRSGRLWHTRARSLS